MAEALLLVRLPLLLAKYFKSFWNNLNRVVLLTNHAMSISCQEIKELSHAQDFSYKKAID
jgi:hypothetical protein